MEGGMGQAFGPPHLRRPLEELSISIELFPEWLAGELPHSSDDGLGSQRIAMRRMIWLLALVLQGQDQKLPVPDAADQRKAEAEIRSVFKEDFVKKTRDGKRAFAARLLAEAADAKNTPTSRYVVLLLSRDLAVEALDVGTILASIDQLGKLYEVTKP